jgi:hypothetical protein
MVFKLGLEAQKHWRRPQGFELIPRVVTGVRFVDVEEQPPPGRLIIHFNKDAPLPRYTTFDNISDSPTWRRASKLTKHI